MSWKSKLLTFVVILLQLGSGILAITAMVTKYWGVIPSQSAHFGLSTLCTNYEYCVSGKINGADDVQNLLATVFGVGSGFALTFLILELIRTFACFALLGGVSCFLALLGFAAMTHAVVVLNSAFGSLYQLSWSYAVGWMSVLSAASSAVLSFYLCWTKPKTTESPASVQTAIQTVAGDLQYPAVANEWIVPPKV